MDHDLQSIQQVRDLLDRAVAAQRHLATLSQARIDQICEAMVRAGEAAAERLARLAHQETGYGRVESKVLKNQLATTMLWDSIRSMRTVGVLHQDDERGVVEIAEPMGVVAAIVPVTNPTSTALYKAIISIKARNAVVVSPHPNAARCVAESIRVVREAAEAAGCPEGAINCLTVVDMAGTQELMRHRKTGVILATGGSGLVRAAYSSGKPAYGVGPGNVPTFIERSADLPAAVRNIIESKTFDNGTLCSSEQSVVTEEAIAERVVAEFRRQGARFLSADEADRVAAVLIQGKRINPKLVGQAPRVIAQAAGFDVGPECRVLIARATEVGWSYPLSMEKLSTVLTFYVEKDWVDACHRCIEVLRFGGMGHSMSIHSRNPEIVQAFAFKKPASRIIVNSGTSQGTVGISTGLPPAMTLGCGTMGNNITTENITPRHLLNVKRVAFALRDLEGRPLPDPLRWTFPVEPPEYLGGLPADSAAKSAALAATVSLHPETPQPPGGGSTPASSGRSLSDEELRDIVAHVLQSLHTSS